ncbi:MAG: hypothetical protein MK224_00180 [Candidatus Nitrosopelagicus sp.]|nr:hypothetical protein [Candidatus Nitrosopelagicus sp.]
MFKSLVLVLLVLSSIFAVPAAYSSHQVCEPGYIETKDLETGFVKCVFVEKVVEEIGTEMAEFEFVDFQEHIQVVVNTKDHTSEIMVSLLSPNWQDILIPPKLEKAIFNSERLHAVIFTNEWQCAPGIAADPCILVQITREGLGEFTETIQKNTRPITDQIIMDSQFIGINAKFHSIIIESAKPSEGKPALATAVYTTKVFPTQKLVSLIGNQLLDKEIRDGGGFYDVLNKLTENDFSEFSLTLRPDNDEILRTITVSLTTSGLPKEMISDTINPLDLIAVSVPNFTGDEVYRSKYFSEGFFPINSIFNVIVITEPDYKVKSVNGGLIPTIRSSADLQDSGWFFTSNSNGKIEGRYLFGTDSSASNQDLIFSITNNKSEYLGIELETSVKVTESESPEPPGGGCLIATAAFGSEMAPQVQLLREIRDNTVLQTESGTSFMTGFNQFYYSFSPAIADYERENPVFKEAVKLSLTPLLTSLTLLQYADIDSESEMLGYGIGIIMLNIGMYLLAPAVVTLKLVKKYRKINF